MEVIEKYMPNVGAFVGVVIEHALRSPRKVSVDALIAHVDPDTRKVVIGEYDVQESIRCDGFWDGVGHSEAGVLNVETNGVKARIELHTRIDALKLVKMDDGREILMTNWAFQRKDQWLHFDV